ncbi:MAG TPA: hypothetical protein VMV69_21730 [Pirellulales bacterium]|nr:hypothetical protein [Pirellulales bacterium]
MPTDTAILAQLQALWRQAATVPPTTTSTTIGADSPAVESPTPAAAIRLDDWRATNDDIAQGILDGEPIHQAKGKAMISGYPSPLYDRLLTGWTRRVRIVANSAAGGKTKRKMLETVWCNFDAGEKNELYGD